MLCNIALSSNVDAYLSPRSGGNVETNSVYLLNPIQPSPYSSLSVTPDDVKTINQSRLFHQSSPNKASTAKNQLPCRNISPNGRSPRCTSDHSPRGTCSQTRAPRIIRSLSGTSPVITPGSSPGKSQFGGSTRGTPGSSPGRSPVPGSSPSRSPVQPRRVGGSPGRYSSLYSTSPTRLRQEDNQVVTIFFNLHIYLFYWNFFLETHHLNYFYFLLVR